jgi:hypothetical protein
VAHGAVLLYEGGHVLGKTVNRLRLGGLHDKRQAAEKRCSTYKFHSALGLIQIVVSVGGRDAKG